MLLLFAIGSIAVMAMIAISIDLGRTEKKRMATAKQKENHAREFTTIEVEVLTLWNALQDAGFGALARDLVDAGLMHEHFNSLLDSDPAARTAEENTTLARLQATKEAMFQAGRNALNGVVDSHE